MKWKEKRFLLFKQKVGLEEEKKGKKKNKDLEKLHTERSQLERFKWFPTKNPSKAANFPFISAFKQLLNSKQTN